MLSQQELDQLAIDAAYVQMLKSISEGGFPIGSSLMTRSGAIVAVGHNRREQDGDTTAHGEMVAMRNAGRRRDWHELTLATTLSPCAMCSGMTVLHRIPRVIIADNVNFQGRENWLRDAKVEVVLMPDERCIETMRAWIEKNPDRWGEDIGKPPT
ncbi:MAG: nucleoside deaminase [Phycisphaeraceae bacterium]|nr:nucleoside deaminase [Phycisphaeraceae bacterium]